MNEKAKGGFARAAAMTPTQRSECARKAAIARWSNPMSKNKKDRNVPRKGQDSEPLTREEKLLIYDLVQRGFHAKRIAPLFDVNQGRISEAVAEIENGVKGD